MSSGSKSQTSGGHSLFDGIQEIVHISLSIIQKVRLLKALILNRPVINGLNSPRCFSPVSDSRLMYQVCILTLAIIVLSSNTISGYIDIKDLGINL